MRQVPDAIRAISAEAEKAIGNRNYPRARTLLDQLASEIRIRTYLLPLATYPAAMQEAARLLDQKKAEEAKQVLLTALNTLQVVEAPIAIPVAMAKASVANAQAQRDKDKDAAHSQLALAKAHIDRGLGQAVERNSGHHVGVREIKGKNQQFVSLIGRMQSKKTHQRNFSQARPICVPERFHGPRRVRSTLKFQDETLSVA